MHLQTRSISLALLALLAFSVLASAFMQQQASALSAINFTTVTTMTSANQQFQQVYENSTLSDVGRTVLFMDADGAGTYYKRTYIGATAGLASTTYTLSGSGNTINSAGYTSPIDLSRYSLQFNGSTQYATASSAPVFDVTTGSFSLWGDIYRNSDSGGNEAIVYKKAAGNVAGYGVRINSSDKLEAFFGDGTGTNIFVSTTGSVSTGVWYMWAASFNRAGNLVIYLYNVNTATTESASVAISSQASSATNAQTFTVGRDSASAAQFCPCNIDDLGVLIGTAINASQFTSLTSNARAVTPSAFYDFNEGITNVAISDRIGANPLSPFNNPTYSSNVATNSLSRLSHYITGRDTATGKNGYAKITTSDLSKVGDAYQTSSYYPRAIAQSTANLYSPLYDSTTNGNMLLGIQTRALGSYSEPSIYTGSSGNPAHGIVADDSSATGTVGANLFAGSAAFATEKITATSSLIGKKLDKITLYLSKTGAPTGTATIGVFTQAGATTFTCNTQNVASLTGSQTAYTYLCNSGPYVVQSGDYIGIKFTGGSGGNTVDVWRTTTDVFDSTNSIFSQGLATISADDATADLKFVFVDTANVKIAVLDGSPDTEYVFFESGASSLAVVKYTSSATTISTSLSHTAGKPYSIMQMSGAILIQTDSTTYSLNTSTDAITTAYSNTFLTRYPQTFSISPSVRIYNSAAPMIASSTAAYFATPNTGVIATTGILVSSTDDTAGTLTTYQPAKYYYLPTNLLTIEASTATGTTWTIKALGSSIQVAPTAYSERLGVSLSQNSTLYSLDVFRIVCDTGSYHVIYSNYAIGNDDDCNNWFIYDTSSGDAPRQLPYTTTSNLVHTNPYGLYTFTLSAADPSQYFLYTIYDGKNVDSGDFDDSGQLQQRLLYQQCYTIQVTEINTGNSVQNGNICAGDVTTKTISLNGIVIPANWLQQTWSHVINRSFTNSTANGLTFTVQKSSEPYSVNIYATDHPDPALASFSHWFNFTGATGVSVANLTNFNIPSNSTVFFYGFENSTRVIYDVSSGQGFALGELSQFNNLGLLFGLPIAIIFPIITAAVFPRSYAHFGLIVTGAVIGIMQFFGFFDAIPFNEGMWAVSFVVIAAGVMLGRR